MTPSIDASLLGSLEQAEIHALLASEAAAPTRDIAAKRFGSAAAFINRTQPNTLFNRVVGVGEDEAESIADIVAWFHSFGIPPRFDICPLRRGKRLTTALHSHNLAPEPMASFTRRIMVSAVSSSPNQSDGDERDRDFTIRLVESDADILAFIDIQIEIWPEDGFQREGRIQQLRASRGRSDIRRYLVWRDGRPVATAALALAPPVGWLSTGAVLEPARGRGIQSALIARRIADAAAANCTHIASLVSPESASERNLRRAGFALACDRELWLPSEWMDHPFYRDAG